MLVLFHELNEAGAGPRVTYRQCDILELSSIERGSLLMTNSGLGQGTFELKPDAFILPGKVDGEQLFNVL